MARTKRNISYANLYARNIRYANYRRNEHKAYLEITEILGNCFVDNRLRSALNRIPTNYEDLDVAAWNEVYRHK